ncbi:hypothetical protein F2P81_017057 [Scophthalmus maximus]|uniref:Uncharacterized protein n=1 Tax=Scophthalmus maximus TaxID=52904 RepID=A0A6A4S550_SCOMX|nr:hypothetical protein F2P81_017057 [Scophthalmus maximus]
MRVRVRGGQRERGVGRGRGPGQRRGPVRRCVSDDIRATLMDHVINHGLSMREAGQRVHPNPSRYTVASIIRTFRLENRMVGRPLQGGRERLFTQQQELAIKWCEKIMQSDLKHNFRMKQLYRVPFERNSVRVKDLRHDYVQRVLDFDAARTAT